MMPVSVMYHRSEIMNLLDQRYIIQGGMRIARFITTDGWQEVCRFGGAGGVFRERARVCYV